MTGLVPASARDTAAALLAAVALVAMLGQGIIGAVDTIRDGGATAAKNSHLDFADREIAWGNGWMLSQNGLYAARSLIPVGAAYDFVIGDASEFQDPLTYPFAESYIRYWLMPRYQHEGARLVVCFRCDLSRLGAGTALVWGDEPAGVFILRRPRAAES